MREPLDTTSLPRRCLTYEKPVGATPMFPFPLTGKDKGGVMPLIGSRAPLSVPFPIKGGRSPYDAAISCHFTLCEQE